MKKEESLVEQDKKVKGIGKIINNITELIKSRLDKNYILSEKSPDFIKKNRKFILKTIESDKNYLNLISDEILLEELLQQQIPTNGIIDTAFKNGYILNSSSPDILVGEKAKRAILRYLEIKTDGVSQGNLFNNNELIKININISSLLRCIDESIMTDEEFKNKFIDSIIMSGYKVADDSPSYLLQNDRIAEIYYKDILENNNVDDILDKSILNAELLKNKKFLNNYIVLLKQKGISTETIVNTLIQNEECVSTLKNDLELFEIVFENINVSNLNTFFDNFFDNNELDSILSDSENLNGKLLRLSNLYAKDKTILQCLNGNLLDERYSNIPDYKMQIIAHDNKFQHMILELNDFEYILYSKMTHLVSEQTDRWNRFEKNIVEHLADGLYSELIEDLHRQANNGNKITDKNIETLTFLFSKTCTTKSFLNEQVLRGFEDENERNQLIRKLSDNVFNITTKIELEHFEEIKELVCDSVLCNPSLDDEQLTDSIKKYLVQFEGLSELDRMKLALLEKNYNIDLKEANVIVKELSTDIDETSFNDEYEASIIEQIKAIKNIFECNDINILKQISDLDLLVKTDLSVSTYLMEQTKEMFAQLYKKDLYMPKENEKIGNVIYNERNIEVFNANTDFAMIVKRVDSSEENSQKIWNSLTKDDEKGKVLRYYTSASYMTDENLLYGYNNNQIILGFGQNTNNYSFEGMYTGDSSTQFRGGDMVYNLYEGCRLPENLEINTDNRYNEIVINTLGTDENGNVMKMQPDYIIYMKEKSDIDISEFENDPLWDMSQKAASEFGIPIVVVDKEKIKESEKNKIYNMSERIEESTNIKDKLKFVKKVEHYVSRYGEEGIKEYASYEKLKSLREYIEQKQAEEQKNISIPKINTNVILEQIMENRQNIINRQEGLKKGNIIHGDEER